ncbi:hypothetical protein J7384_16980 [Endozoicomonas sp. G2_1]|uniref:hypothetical protein n=1 Tax=Endozoicomonas sp. G2_1 TaxID=2821091 RepID=UPI001ADBEAEF|nr:hypothetical protein [Endozoicomonas sp. G2_1]MBO9492058.1 hypothetical protein [Endozoicomonas sp. G2_1]
MFKDFLEAILFYIPHFVTDRVALAYDEKKRLYVYCLEEEVQSSDKKYIAYYGTCKSIAFLGIGYGGVVTLDKKSPSNR